MKKGIKIGTMPKVVNIDGRIKLEEGMIITVKEVYNIEITEINDFYIKAEPTSKGTKKRRRR